MCRVTSSIWATFPIFYGIYMEERTCEAKRPHINRKVVRKQGMLGDTGSVRAPSPQPAGTSPAWQPNAVSSSVNQCPAVSISRYVSCMATKCSVKQCQSVSSSVNQPVRLLHGNQMQWQAVSSSVKQCQSAGTSPAWQPNAVSSSVNQCQAVSNSVNQCQAVSSSRAVRPLHNQSNDTTWGFAAYIYPAIGTRDVCCSLCGIRDTRSIYLTPYKT